MIKHNPLGNTPEEFSAHCRQMDRDQGRDLHSRYLKLVESLQTYVSGDDIELSREQFLLMVRDRINDDLNAMRRASC
jgi:hypothetical protein